MCNGLLLASFSPVQPAAPGQRAGVGGYGPDFARNYAGSGDNRPGRPAAGWARASFGFARTRYNGLFDRLAANITLGAGRESAGPKTNNLYIKKQESSLFDSALSRLCFGGFLYL